MKMINNKIQRTPNPAPLCLGCSAHQFSFQPKTYLLLKWIQGVESIPTRVALACGSNFTLLCLFEYPISTSFYSTWVVPERLKNISGLYILC